MTRSCLILILVAMVVGRSARADVPIDVDPADLANRRDLINKEIAVEDRIRLFYPHPGRGVDEIHLKRTPIVFRLPPTLRYNHTPTAPAVRVQGILRSEADGLVCDVTATPLLYPSDLQRLNSVVERLPAQDVKSRNAWADWAAHRASAFNDQPLAERASAIHAEALKIETNQPNLPAEQILKYAQSARDMKIPEPEPSALAHRGFRMRLDQAKTAADYDRIAEEVARFFPNTSRPARENPTPMLAPYGRDPAATYRLGDADLREALDRRLYTDALVGSIRLRTARSARDFLTLADDSGRTLPDRPEVAARFRDQARDAVGTNVGSLRQDEMLALARAFREELRDPAKADELTRSWLEDRRKHLLSPTDAEGRIILADQYLALLRDKKTAADLLRAAIEIDPQARRPAENIFLKMGYRRVQGDWAPPETSGGEAEETDSPRGGDPFIGMTPNEVRAQLGKPEKVCRVASQGRLSIQWIYRSTKGSQYIDFLQRIGDPQPAVVGRYAGQ